MRNDKRPDELPIRRCGGFTLIEILLVVVIIGILAGIAVPKFSGRVQQSQISSARMEIKGISTAIRVFEMDMGRFPNSLDELMNNPGGDNWNGPYIDDLEDPWGNTYQYKAPGTHNPSSFDLSSPGPEGGDQVIGNWKTD